MRTGTFLTEQKRAKSTFENKYLERYGNRAERRVDLPGLSPAMISKKAELDAIALKLANEKENHEKWLQEYENKKRIINKRYGDFEEEEKMHQQFNHHANFEIEKTKKQENQEFESLHNLQLELAQLTEEEQYLKDRVAELNKKISVLQPSADFLDEACNETKIFETPEAIIHRYESLVNTKKERNVLLKNKLGFNSDDPDNPHSVLMHLKNILIERAHQLTKVKLEIANLKQQKRYARITQVKKVERTNEKESEYATTVAAIRNICLYVTTNKSMVQHKALQIEFPTTVEGQLELIERRFLDLQAIVTDPEAIHLMPENVATFENTISTRRSPNRVALAELGTKAVTSNSTTATTPRRSKK